jgi:hypothetical protein
MKDHIPDRSGRIILLQFFQILMLNELISKKELVERLNVQGNGIRQMKGIITQVSIMY